MSRSRRRKHKRIEDQAAPQPIAPLDDETIGLMGEAIASAWQQGFGLASAVVLKAKRPDALGLGFAPALHAQLLWQAFVQVVPMLTGSSPVVRDLLVNAMAQLVASQAQAESPSEGGGGSIAPHAGAPVSGVPSAT